jgi:hypothetical protein
VCGFFFFLPSRRGGALREHSRSFAADPSRAHARSLQNRTSTVKLPTTAKATITITITITTTTPLYGGLRLWLWLRLGAGDPRGARRMLAGAVAMDDC